MRDTAISLKFPPDFSVDFPWFLLIISEDSPGICDWFISYESTKSPHKFCRESQGNPQRINTENSPQFPRGFSFQFQPKFTRGFPSPMYPPSPGIPRRICVMLPAGCHVQEQLPLLWTNFKYTQCELNHARPQQLTNNSTFTQVAVKYENKWTNVPAANSGQQWSKNAMKVRYVLGL